MDTLKTGFVVMLLLAVLYGVYVVLNKDQAPPSAEIAWHQQEAGKDLQIDFGTASEAKAPSPGTELGVPSILKAELSPAEASPPAPAFSSTTPPATPSASETGATSMPPPTVSAATPETVPSLPQTPESASANPATPAVAAPGLLAASPPSVDQDVPPQPQEQPVAAPALMTEAPAKPSTQIPEVPPSLAKTATPAEVVDAVSGTAPVPPSERATSATLTSPAAAGFPSTGLPELNPQLPESPAEPTAPIAAKVVDAAPEPVTNPSKPEPAAALAEVVESTLPGAPQAAKPTNRYMTEAAQAEQVASREVQASATSPAATVESRPRPNAGFDVAWKEARSNLASGRYYQALFLLTSYYDSPEIDSQKRQQLLDMLDPLAAKVIYSREHLVAEPHVLGRGETLAQIADKYQVPAPLLSKINGLTRPEAMPLGTSLKVVRGPFRAEISLAQQEMTLFAGQLYAGRFALRIGQDPAPTPGEYRVLEKQLGKVFYAGGGQTVPPESPQNPYGRVWIGLDKDLALHGSPASQSSSPVGCLAMSPRDAQDVYDILSVGSSVTIRP